MQARNPVNEPVAPALLACVDIICQFGREWRELKAKRGQASAPDPPAQPARRRRRRDRAPGIGANAN